MQDVQDAVPAVPDDVRDDVRDRAAPLDVIVLGDGLAAASLVHAFAKRGVSTALVCDGFVGQTERGATLFSGAGDGAATRSEGVRLARLAPVLAREVFASTIQADNQEERTTGYVIDVARLAQLLALDAEVDGARVLTGQRVDEVRHTETGRFAVVVGGAVLSARAVVSFAELSDRPVARLTIDFDARIDAAHVVGDDDGDDTTLAVFPTPLGARVVATARAPFVLTGPFAALVDAPDPLERASRVAVAVRALAIAASPVLRDALEDAPALAVALRHDAGATDAPVARVPQGTRGFLTMNPLASTTHVDRAFAEVCAHLGRAVENAPITALRSGQPGPPSAWLAERHAVPELFVRALSARLGMPTHDVLEATTSRPEARATVCACELVLECEVRHAVRRERARSVAEVASRTRVGMGTCGGMRCAHRAAQIVAEECGSTSDDAHRDAIAFIERAYRARLPLLTAKDLAREQLLAARLVYGGATRATRDTRDTVDDDLHAIDAEIDADRGAAT